MIVWGVRRVTIERKAVVKLNAVNCELKRGRCGSVGRVGRSHWEPSSKSARRVLPPAHRAVKIVARADDLAPFRVQSNDTAVLYNALKDVGKFPYKLFEQLSFVLEDVECD